MHLFFRFGYRNTIEELEYRTDPEYSGEGGYAGKIHGRFVRTCSFVNNFDITIFHSVNVKVSCSGSLTAIEGLFVHMDLF